MSRLAADVNSIAEAAANGLPFCGTDEEKEKTGAFFHVLSAVVTKYDIDRLFLIVKPEDGLVGDIEGSAEEKKLSVTETDDTFRLLGALSGDDSEKSYILTMDRDLCLFASADTTVILITFDEEGSHFEEVNEPVSPDYLALRTVFGRAVSEALLEQYGSADEILKDPSSVDFFGAEETLKEHSDEIREKLCFLRSDIPEDVTEKASELLSDEKAALSEKSFETEPLESAADTSGIAFFTELDDAAVAAFTEEAQKRLSEGKKLIFYDLKALLHSLGAASGYDFELRRDLTQEENGQLSFTADNRKKSPAAEKLYQLIMRTEELAWNESQSSDESYGQALHKYFEDVKIEGYIVDPLSDTECKNASEVAEAHVHFSKELSESGQEKLYEELELPLIFVLYDMEKTGIYMEADRLKEYGQRLQVQIDSLEKKIYAEAGEEFNINSPKQLGEILFGKLGLPKGRKTKTGYSTSQKVLDELSEDYPVVADVLEYRRYAKLKSTYADGLFTCVSMDGRVHTTYQQTVTATGRLSSTDPNLQNIPIRLELGKQIRKVFLPAKDSLFLDADYSQIELRVLAHMSGDENLIEAYKADRDIHTATAAAVFHVSADQVTPLMRRSAKAVNFGIVYGISSFGLGQNLSISRKEAQQYINDYFKAYPGLHAFLDGLVDSAKLNGYAETMYGRRRPVPELKDSQYMRRQFGERVAMNAPIQGSAADIIKIAMLHVYERLRKEGMRSKLLLQVHDELLIEAPVSEKEEAERILKEEMENAAELKVPLEVDLEEGNDWYSAH
ncbi:MAG: DNA polymerase I [Candidatus Weimeria sp.]